MNYKKALSKRFGTSTCKTSSSSIAIALIGGIAIGSLVSLLFAPQSGEDTRDMLASKSKDLKDSIKDQIKSMKKKLQSEADELVDDAKDKYRSVKKQATEMADNTKDKFNTAKQNTQLDT